MTEKKITNAYRLHNAIQLMESIDEEANSSYYMFAAKHTPYDVSDSFIEVPLDTEEYKNGVYRNMLFGKRVSSNNAFLIVNRNDWTGNTVFTQYDDTDPDLFSKPFYAIVNAASLYHVYKCLFNNNDAESTIEPDFNVVSENDDFFETSDGYIWKYMYSVSDTIMDKFSTSTKFPVQSNTTVADNAKNGAINVINVDNPGNNYNHYVTGDNQLNHDDLRLDGNTLLYDISGNTSTATTNNYYNGCYIYIKAGAPTEVGQYRKIVDYFVNSTSKAIVLESAFEVPIGLSAVYDIYPGVVIEGDGTQTVNAEARAIVNAVTNTVHRIEMLNLGLDYQTATAYIYSYPDVGVTSNAELRVIASPYGGHGANAEIELGATSLMFNVAFEGSESNTIVQSNEYRTVGILKDPLFSYVAVNVELLQGTFLAGEDVYEVNPILVTSEATTATTSNVVTAHNGDFLNQFAPGERIFLNEDGLLALGNTIIESATKNFLGTVSSVTNSSHLVLTTNCSFTASGDGKVFVPRLATHGVLDSSNTTFVNLTDVNGTIATGSRLVGSTSGAYAVANTIYRGGEAKGFNTFVNTYKYLGSIVSGEFEQDEVISQDLTANGVLYAADTGVDEITKFYVTNHFGEFAVGDNITGNTSSALASITEKHDPEVTFRSGEIMYLENVNPITRVTGQSETFKIIFEF